MEERLEEWEVFMRSVPGHYAQYQGSVKVWAGNEEEAVEAAYRKLRQGAFPDRGREAWKVESIVRL